MKKITLAALLLISFSALYAQSPKWYVAVSSGAGWGGPNASLKKTFEKKGFNQTSTSLILFMSFTADYPKVSSGVPAAVRAGVQLKENLNLFAIAGTSAAGEVNGYKNTSNEIASFLGIFGGSVGRYIAISHKVTEVAVGLEHQLKNSHLRLGYAPAAYLMRYHNIHSLNTGKKTAFVPGLAFTGRLPLGKEKRRIGAELVADINLAPPATIEAQYDNEMDDNGINRKVQVLGPTKVSMVHGTMGLALTYRKK